MASGKLSRRDVDEVLRRAAELEAERRAKEHDPDHDSLGEPDLYRLAEEAGLSTDAVRTALGEARADGRLTRSATDDEAAGDEGRIRISRIVPGPAEPVARAVERFLRDQLMVVRRHHGSRVEWQRARGLWPGLARSWAFAQKLAFGPVTRVETCVELLGPGETRVSFDIDVGPWRRDRWWRAGTRAAFAFGFFGLGGAWLFPGFGAADLIALLAGGGIAGGLVALERKRVAQHRDEIAVAPERFLDRLVIRRKKALAEPAPRAALGPPSVDGTAPKSDEPTD